jgi:hypothetical protein
MVDNLNVVWCSCYAFMRVLLDHQLFVFDVFYLLVISSGCCAKPGKRILVFQIAYVMREDDPCGMMGMFIPPIVACSRVRGHVLKRVRVFRVKGTFSRVEATER